jgi:hypothetical protein
VTLRSSRHGERYLGAKPWKARRKWAPPTCSASLRLLCLGWYARLNRNHRRPHKLRGESTGLVRLLKGSCTATEAMFRRRWWGSHKISRRVVGMSCWPVRDASPVLQRRWCWRHRRVQIGPSQTHSIPKPRCFKKFCISSNSPHDCGTSKWLASGCFMRKPLHHGNSHPYIAPQRPSSHQECPRNHPTRCKCDVKQRAR